MFTYFEKKDDPIVSQALYDVLVDTNAFEIQGDVALELGAQLDRCELYIVFNQDDEEVGFFILKPDSDEPEHSVELFVGKYGAGANFMSFAMNQLDSVLLQSGFNNRKFVSVAIKATNPKFDRIITSLFEHGFCDVLELGLETNISQKNHMLRKVAEGYPEYNGYLNFKREINPRSS